MVWPDACHAVIDSHQNWSRSALRRQVCGIDGTSATFATSPGTPITPPPTSFTAASSSACRRPVMTIFAPSAANRLAVARPIPLDPTVITTTLPSRSPEIERSFDESASVDARIAPPREMRHRTPGDRSWIARGSDVVPRGRPPVAGPGHPLRFVLLAVGINGRRRRQGVARRSAIRSRRRRGTRRCSRCRRLSPAARAGPV